MEEFVIKTDYGAFIKPHGTDEFDYVVCGVSQAHKFTKIEVVGFMETFKSDFLRHNMEVHKVIMATERYHFPFI